LNLSDKYFFEIVDIGMKWQTAIDM